MTKPSAVDKLLEENPPAQNQAASVREAILMVDQLRSLGRPKKHYELETPFGDREWLRTLRLAAPRS